MDRDEYHSTIQGLTLERRFVSRNRDKKDQEPLLGQKMETNGFDPQTERPDE